MIISHGLSRITSMNESQDCPATHYQTRSSVIYKFYGIYELYKFYSICLGEMPVTAYERGRRFAKTAQGRCINSFDTARLAFERFLPLHVLQTNGRTISHVFQNFRALCAHTLQILTDWPHRANRGRCHPPAVINPARRRTCTKESCTRSRRAAIAWGGRPALRPLFCRSAS